jgi:signal transduction histidine kinase
MNGHGLGLNISHNIAKLMNGSLTVKSDYGKGSNFTLTINTLVSVSN